MHLDLNIFTAFLAGVASFLAPCTFSTVPIFLSYISGVSVAENSSHEKFGRVFRTSLFYSAGFILFFAVLGLGLNFLGGFFSVHRDVWRVVGGIIIIILGIYMLFQEKFKVVFLMSHHKFQLPRFNKENTVFLYFGAFLIGFVNAFAWSPCIGPIYGQIFTLSLTSSTAGSGFLYSVIYACGLVFPFILMAIFFGSSKKIVGKLSKHTKVIYTVMALIFILIGISLITDLFNSLLVSNLFKVFNSFGFDETKLPI